MTAFFVRAGAVSDRVFFFLFFCAGLAGVGLGWIVKAFT